MGSGGLFDDASGTSSGSPAFDALRETLASDHALRAELEAALDLNVRRVNPTDRANRFGSGAAVEWILAAAAYAANVLSVPGGHNTDGFDLRDVRNDARGLWSVKNTTKKSPFRISNGMGGSGAGFTDPVVFLSPDLPGITFIDPNIHRVAASGVVEKPDAAILPFGVVERHANDHPECVAACRMPSNPGTGQDDPWMDYVDSLLAPERFPRLSSLFAASKPVAGTLSSEVTRLIEMRDAGQIDAAQFDALIQRLGA